MQRVAAGVQHLLAILDDQAVIIHGHSVKGIEQVICCYENANETSSWIDLVSPESARFCSHFSHFGYAVQLIPERGFSYRACDEEMPKPLLVLMLLKIISRYQWYISSIDIVSLIDRISKYSKEEALKVLISVVASCLR